MPPGGRHGGLVVIPREHLLRHEDLLVQTVYTHPNPLVRWLFWSRLREILKRIPPGVETALDAGCGEGCFLPSLARQAKRVYAVDLDTRAAAALVRDYDLTNVQVMRGDLYALPLRSGTCQVVVAADVLEHLRQPMRGLFEIRRILAPGGKCIASVPMEHTVYRVGRRFFGFRKPGDHYADARQLEAKIAKVLVLRRRRYFPLPPASLAAFALLDAYKPPHPHAHPQKRCDPS